MSKKIQNERELIKEAVRIGMAYAEKRGTVKFEKTDSSKEKVEYVYRLLVLDKVIQPLAKGQESQPNMSHKLALWVQKNLPADHPLKS